MIGLRLNGVWVLDSLGVGITGLTLWVLRVCSLHIDKP